MRWHFKCDSEISLNAAQEIVEVLVRYVDEMKLKEFEMKIIDSEYPAEKKPGSTMNVLQLLREFRSSQVKIHSESDKTFIEDWLK